MFEGIEGPEHRIGEAALLAHFAEQARGHRARAAQHMGGDDAGDKVRVVALERRPAEADRRLRHVEIDPVDRAEARESALGDGLQIPLGRQIGERLVDQRRRVFLVDRADDRDQQLVARDPALGGLDRSARSMRASVSRVPLAAWP